MCMYVALRMYDMYVMYLCVVFVICTHAMSLYPLGMYVIDDTCARMICTYAM